MPWIGLKCAHALMGVALVVVSLATLPSTVTSLTTTASPAFILSPTYPCHLNVTVNVSADFGYITTPGYPYADSNNQRCTWRIRTTNSTQWLQFTTIAFDLEEYGGVCYDKVTFKSLMTDESAAGPYCGTVFNVLTIDSSYVEVNISSDSTIDHWGFLIQFEAIDNNSQCNLNGRVNVYADSGYITTPGYPNAYSNSQRCTWRIRTTNSTRWLQFTAIAFDLKEYGGVCYDKVTFKSLMTDESAAGPYCGTVFNVLTIDSSYVEVNFSSDSSVFLSGFTIRFEAIAPLPSTATPLTTVVSSVTTGSANPTTVAPAPIRSPHFPCNINVTVNVSADFGYITTPGYPNAYSNSQRCTWRIRTTNSTQWLRFTAIAFDLEEYGGIRCDGVTFKSLITDGSAAGPFCGTVFSVLLFDSSYVEVDFSSSNISNGGSGFQLRFEAFATLPSTVTPLTTATSPGFNTTQGIPGSTSDNPSIHLEDIIPPIAAAVIIIIVVATVVVFMVRRKRAPLLERYVESPLHNRIERSDTQKSAHQYEYIGSAVLVDEYLEPRPLSDYTAPLAPQTDHHYQVIGDTMTTANQANVSAARYVDMLPPEKYQHYTAPLAPQTDHRYAVIGDNMITKDQRNASVASYVDILPPAKYQGRQLPTVPLPQTVEQHLAATVKQGIEMEPLYETLRGEETHNYSSPVSSAGAQQHSRGGAVNAGYLEP